MYMHKRPHTHSLAYINHDNVSQSAANELMTKVAERKADKRHASYPMTDV